MTDNNADEAKSKEMVRATGNDGDSSVVAKFCSVDRRIFEGNVKHWWWQLSARLEQIGAEFVTSTKISQKQAWHFLRRVFQSSRGFRKKLITRLQAQQCYRCLNARYLVVCSSCFSVDLLWLSPLPLLVGYRINLSLSSLVLWKSICNFLNIVYASAHDFWRENHVTIEGEGLICPEANLPSATLSASVV